jgi:hypothetical protein
LGRSRATRYERPLSGKRLQVIGIEFVEALDAPAADLVGVLETQLEQA